jgi:hypothetical protein
MQAGPKALEHLFLRHHAVAVGDEIGEQPEHLRAQRDGPLPAEELVPIRVQGVAAELVAHPSSSPRSPQGVI